MDEKVRVIRVLEYVGSRKRVENVLKRSIHTHTVGDVHIEEIAKSGFTLVLEPEPLNEALEGAIKKWQRIVDRTGSDRGSANCPLCQENKTPTGDVDCTDCIVGSKSAKHCAGTPYARWTDHHIHVHRSGGRKIIHCDQCEDYAIQELEFLKTLR